MEAWQAIIIGILQGLTEFLPISSSAHLILVPAFTGWPDQGVAFDLAVHVGTLLAVVLYFRRDVARLLSDWIRSLLLRRHVGESHLAWGLLWGTVPTGLAGLLLLEAIDNSLRSIGVIIATTVIFAALLGLADIKGARTREIETIGWKDILVIGCAQALSLIPGTSRSGATITAGLFMGLTRKAASRFSFLLAIPITALAAGVKLVEYATTDARIDWLSFVIGGAAAFITALLAIHYFLKWLNRFGMLPYVLYRFGLAVLLYWVFV